MLLVIVATIARARGTRWGQQHICSLVRIIIAKDSVGELSGVKSTRNHIKFCKQ